MNGHSKATIQWCADTQADDQGQQQMSITVTKTDEDAYSWLNDPVAQQEYREWLDQLDRESRIEIKQQRSNNDENE